MSFGTVDFFSPTGSHSSDPLPPMESPFFASQPPFSPPAGLVSVRQHVSHGVNGADEGIFSQGMQKIRDAFIRNEEGFR